jgi:hypothetical protein
MPLQLPWRCSHSWGFPRRWARFAAQANVDVQTCTKCGARRLSPVQFGARETAPEPEQRDRVARFAEVR